MAPPLFDPSSIETDADLLTITSFKEDDKNASDKAFSEFHKKYSEFLYNYIYKHCKHHPNRNDITDEVFSATVLKVYKSCHTFSADGIKDKDVVSGKIKSWLATIAHNEYLNLMLKSQKERESFKQYADALHAHKRLQSRAIKKDKHSKVLQDALGSLTERDRLVLLTCMEFQVDGKKLPSDVTQSVCDQFEIKEENRKQIISRGKRKIREFLTAKGIIEDFQ